MAVTVLGLLGTFLLPWPGDGPRVEPVASEVAMPVEAVSRTAEAQRCVLRDSRG